MPKKAGRNTKSRIVSAAWKLFYLQGYDNTTVEDIVAMSETSKGSFYHYFSGKDDLLGTLSQLFDEKYEELAPQLDASMNAIDKLIFLNQELFSMIDNNVAVELLTQLLSSQLTTKSEKHLLDRSRTYFKMISNIIKEGQTAGQIRTDLSANEIVNSYATLERALMYDWCLSSADYDLAARSGKLLPIFLDSFRQ